MDQPAVPPPRPVDYHPLLPSRRRVSWEALDDVRVANSRLLIIALFLGVALALESVVLVTIFRRPPDILSENDGYITWRTTEVYRLRKDILQSFLEGVLGKLFTVNPGSYDLSSLVGWVDPQVLGVFSGRAAKGAQLRLRLDRRQVYSFYEIKRHRDPRYPDLVAILVRGEQTVFEEQRDEAGNVHVSPDSQIVLHVVYLKLVRPAPRNPWGLVLVGLSRPDRDAAEVAWDHGTEVTDSPLPGSRGQRVAPAKNR